ncbi:acyltransferase family protein [Shewanella sp. 0m-8]
MKKRFEALDGFRGLCAVFVVFFHIHIISSFTEWGFFRGSGIFVEFFFVLSGFVLAHGYGCRDYIDSKMFIRSRVLRLFPLHIFMLGVFVFFELGKFIVFKYGGITFNNLPFTGERSLYEIIPNMLLIQAWSPYTSALSFNYPSWSISIEFYMYLILLLTIVFTGKYKQLIWAALSFVAFFLMLTKSDVLVKEVVSGISSFFGGCIVYMLYRNISHIKINAFVGTFLEIVSIILIVFIVKNEFEFRKFVAILCFFCTVLLFSFESGLVSNLLRNVVIQSLGRLSYSIYMTHAAVLFIVTSLMLVLQKVTNGSFAPMVNGQRMITTGNDVANNLLALVILLVVIAVSIFTHKLIEVRFQSYSKVKVVAGSGK